MVNRKRQYSKLFFKLFLFTVYFIFFTVQIFLRFTSPHSKQFLGADNFLKTAGPKPQIGRSFFFLNNSGKSSYTSTYLNKHYHPKDGVIFPSHDFLSHFFYPDLPKQFFFIHEDVVRIKMAFTPLRGPPSVS